jgi:hypothetical protein
MFMARLALVAALMVIPACKGSDRSSTVPIDRTPTGGSSGPSGAPPIPGTMTGGSIGSATGGAPGTGGAMADAAPSEAGSPLAGRDGGPPLADASAATDGASSGVASDGGVLVCWPDPKVIMICHQLENACENCPPGGAPPKNKAAQDCFDLVERAYKGMASDADCAKFAADHMCTVDNATSTGNLCGSLDCYAPGCKDKARCLDRQQWGDSSMCAQFLATCPCK